MMDDGRAHKSLRRASVANAKRSLLCFPIASPTPNRYLTPITPPRTPSRAEVIKHARDARGHPVRHHRRLAAVHLERLHTREEGALLLGAVDAPLDLREHRLEGAQARGQLDGRRSAAASFCRFLSPPVAGSSGRDALCLATASAASLAVANMPIVKVRFLPRGSAIVPAAFSPCARKRPCSPDLSFVSCVTYAYPVGFLDERSSTHSLPSSCKVSCMHSASSSSSSSSEEDMTLYGVLGEAFEAAAIACAARRRISPARV